MRNNNGISITALINAAIKSCLSFAQCSNNFFGGDSWRGWENWLTVDIARRINNQKITPFASYSECKPNIKGKMDLLIKSPKNIAVEIKVNYWGDDDIERHDGKRKSLPDRAINDIKKLKQLGSDTLKVFLLSTVFESSNGLEKYRDKIFDPNQKCLKDLNWKRYDCSEGGYNLLLVVSNSLRLPEIQR